MFHAQETASNRLSRNLMPRVCIGSLCSLCALLLMASLGAQTVPPGFTATRLATDIASPTAMAFAPDGRLFVCEQGGRLRVIKNGVLLPNAFVTLSVDPTQERGLLGIAFDPHFATNHYVYVYYTTTETPRRNRVSRFTANGDVAVPGSEFVVVNLSPLSNANNHNGGAIHFGPDGRLYIATGDNRREQSPQSLTDRHGKMLRINKDGTIPTDNPFYHQATGPERAIWALGLRNPFTFAFQPGTGRMFINDVGEAAWEEVNEGTAGANYGWPATEGFFDPAAFPNYANPIYAYAQSGNPGGCAISGGAFYNPAAPHFPAGYVGKYFYADYCGRYVRYLDPDSPAASFAFMSGLSWPVDTKVGPDGALYVLQLGSGIVFRVAYGASVSGKVTREDCPTAAEPITVTFRPASGTPFTRTPITASNGNFAVYGIPPNTYQVAIRGSKFLQKVVTADTTSGDVAGLNVTLRGGDANNDNHVDVFDLSELIEAFDATPTDSHWNEGHADFNCDNRVDVFDLDILIRNFDAVGDA